MGFFEKVAACDLFVLLTWCQFEKNNYQNRFNTDKWHTMTVSKKTELVRRKKYLNYEKDWAKITRQFPQLNQFNDCISESLYITNSKLIMQICRKLQIDTPIVFDFHTLNKGTDRLIEICEKHGATSYLSGESGRKYMDLDKFNIPVEFHHVKDRRSIVDVL